MQQAATSSRTRRRRHHLIAFSFLDEFGPLYAIYPLWFAISGLSVAQISVIYVAWGATELLCEVPSGALADRVDRRWLIALALLIRALGIACWFVWPSFAGLLIGAILWALHSALASGAWEALVYDTLALSGDQDSYPVTMARIGQASNLAIAAGALSSSALFGLEVSITVMGWITVLLTLPAVTLMLLLPHSHPEPADELGGVSGWLHTLNQGAKDVRKSPQTFKLAMLGALLGGLFIVDEYVPLLARLRQVPDFAIPLVVATVWGGLLLGGELAARRPDLSPTALGALLTSGSLAMLGGLLAPSPWALLLVAVGYGTLQTTWILSDARFQASIPTTTRATVTSIRAFASGIISLVALAGIGALSLGEDPSPGLAIVALTLALSGLLVRAWVPKR
jgi:MFS family permease